MADMVVAVPAHLERIEREGRFLRRNSTGSLGIPIAKSKVLSRYLSDPKGSCHDVCKGTERDLQTSKARTSLLSRTVAASEKIPELVATVQVQIRKKPLRSSKLPGGSSIAWDSPLDGATSTPNKGRRMDKNTGSSKLGNKKAVGKPANLEKIEHELSYLRRNSTGNLGIEMDDSKVLPRHVSVPTGSLLNASKDGAESNCKTKERTHVSTRSVISSGENSKLATTVKWQIRKKPLRANKLPANFRRLKTTHGEHMQARTKKLAVSYSYICRVERLFPQTLGLISLMYHLFSPHHLLYILMAVAPETLATGNPPYHQLLHASLTPTFVG